MKLSIIIPVYKVEKYLSKCLNSILAQNFSDLEVLLIDDGSPDKSGEICDEYALRDNRIRVFHKPNGGVSSARNVGIRESRADYLAFIDPDDLLFPNCLGEIILQCENRCADIACARAYKFSSLDLFDKEEIFPIPADNNENMHNGVDIYMQNRGARGAVWGNIFRTDFIKSNDLLFVEGIVNGEDSFFMANCYIRNPKILFLKNDYYLFYQREGSATHSWNEGRLNKYINNISYFINELNRVNVGIYYYMLNQQIYGTISNLFYSLNLCFSHTLRRRLCDKIKEELKGRKLVLGPINRDKFKIHILNISVNLYSLLSRILYHIRHLYTSR